jgi:hypothetical protein
MGDQLTPEVEAKGLTAYEQARAFERMRSWRLPVTYALAPILPLALGVAAWRLGYTPLLVAGILFSIFIALRVWMEWKRLRRQYAENLALLANLEKTYGHALPWVQVEHHLAALEELKREIATNQEGPNP